MKAKHFWAPWGVFGLLGLWGVWAFRHEVNEDGISYMHLAQHLLQGEVVDALNAYWSPLYPALQVPFLALGVPALLAARLVQLLAAAAVLLLALRLARAWGLPEWGQRALSWMLAPVLPLWATDLLVPDLPALALLLGVLVQAHRFWIKPAVGRAIGLGMLALAAFFAKAMLGPVLLAGLGLWALLPGLRKRQRLVLGILLALSMMGGGMLGWATALHEKYGRWMLSSAGPYNLALGVELPVHPARVGLKEPPFAGAYSLWQDPTFIPLPEIALDKPATLKALAANMWRNLERTVQQVHPLWWAGLLLWVVLGLARGAPPALPDQWLAVLVCGLLAAAYLPFVVDARYLWLLNVLGPLFSLQALSRLTWPWAPPRWALPLLLGLAVAPALLGFAVRLPFLNSLHHEAQALKPALQQRLGPGPWRVAALADDQLVGYRLAWHWQAVSLGFLETGLSAHDLRQELEAQRAEAWVCWEACPTGPEGWNRVPANSRLEVWVRPVRQKRGLRPLPESRAVPD